MVVYGACNVSEGSGTSQVFALQSQQKRGVN